MRELRASAGVEVDAVPERCLELVADVGGYARWYPEVVQQADVTERDVLGRPTRALVVLRLGVGPLSGTFPLVVSVVRSPDGVELERVPHERADRERFRVAWSVQGSGPVRLAIEAEATLDIPRLVPLGGVGESLVQGFVEAAKRELAG